MVSLNSDVARHRVFYPRPVAPMPDILMVDMCAGSIESAPSSRRFHPLLCETIDDQQDAEAYLDEPRDGPFPSDPLDARPSALPADHIMIAHYAPPAASWPYVLLCRWPPDLTVAAPTDLNLFVRGAYTVELFDDHAQLEQATERLMALLKRLRSMRIEMIQPDWSPTPGAAPH